MNLKAESETARRVSAEDALRVLCFSDAGFRERYDGWCVLGRGSWATVIRTRARDFGRDIVLTIFVDRGTYWTSKPQSPIPRPTGRGTRKGSNVPRRHRARLSYRAEGLPPKQPTCRSAVR